MRKALKTDWKTMDMPPENEAFQMEYPMTPEEYAALQAGLIPKEMEDKWFLYFEEDTLYVHRSWTGFCIYIIRFTGKNGQLQIIVNRNEKEHTNKKLDLDRIMIQMLLGRQTGRPGNDVLMKEYLQKMR